MRAIDYCVLFAAPVVALCSLVTDGSADSKAYKEIELELGPAAGLEEPVAPPAVRGTRAPRIRPLPSVRRARPPGAPDAGASVLRR